MQGGSTTLLMGTGLTVVVVLPLAFLLALNSAAAGLIQPMVRFHQQRAGHRLDPAVRRLVRLHRQGGYTSLVYTAAIPLLFSA